MGAFGGGDSPLLHPGNGHRLRCWDAPDEDVGRCTDDFAGASRVLLRRHRVDNVSFHAPPSLVKAMASGRPLCPELAMEFALTALLQRESPETLIDVAGGARRAREFFDRESSLFGVVADPDAPVAYRFLPPPPDGNVKRDRWIFFLSVPDLSEHGYWVVVGENQEEARVVAAN